MPERSRNMLIALGGNLPGSEGSPTAMLMRAVQRIAAAGMTLRAVSRFFSTPCFPAGAGPDFINAAIAVRCNADPRDVLDRLHGIEAAMGRVRAQRWQERPIDLDLIGADDLILPNAATHRHWRDMAPEDQRRVAPDQLILPHPRLEDRAFVLVPLADIAPDWVHPATGLSVAAMMAALPPADIAGIRPV